MVQGQCKDSVRAGAEQRVPGRAAVGRPGGQDDERRLLQGLGRRARPARDRRRRRARVAPSTLTAVPRAGAADLCRLHALSGAAHVLQQRPHDQAAGRRGVRRARQLLRRCCSPISCSGRRSATPRCSPSWRRSPTCSAGCCWRSACSRGAPLAPLLRVVWFTPVLMSYVVVGIIWVWIYDYDWGLANPILRALGLGAFEQSWLGDPHTALWSVMVTHVWKWLGFNMIIFLAALLRPAGRGAGRRRARQLRLAREARLHHHPDAAADDRQPAGAVASSAR